VEVLLGGAAGDDRSTMRGRWGAAYASCARNGAAITKAGMGCRQLNLVSTRPGVVPGVQAAEKGEVTGNGFSFSGGGQCRVSEPFRLVSCGWRRRRGTTAAEDARGVLSETHRFFTDSTC